MQRKSFGNSGFQVPAVGQGTWNIEAASRAGAVAALQRGVALGMTHIDTAEMYGSGKSEAIVGEAIAGRRDEVFLVSKVLPSNASHKGTLAACERSLRQLKTDRLDCYLLHWRGSIPLAETIAGFEELLKVGKIRSWGVSNFDARDLDELWALRSGSRPVCNQVLYHLQERAIEHAVLPWCERHEVAVVGYSPFGHNNFPGPASAAGKALSEIASAHGATPRQIALAFLTRRASLFAIPKASSANHVEENAGAGRAVLSSADLARLETAFPLGKRVGSLPML